MVDCEEREREWYGVLGNRGRKLEFTGTGESCGRAVVFWSLASSTTATAEGYVNPA